MKKIVQGIFPLLAFFFLVCCRPGTPLGLNESASLQAADGLPENPLLLHAITSSVRPKDSTMSTLYGNDAAFRYASVHGDSQYPEGAVLYEVTWRWQADEQWAGAHIPRAITCVEQVAYGNGGRAVYRLYSGTPLKEVADIAATRTRVAAISGERMAVAP